MKIAAKRVNGVTETKVSYKEGRAEVTYDPTKTTPEAIARAITDNSGFKAEVQKQKESPQK